MFAADSEGQITTSALTSYCVVPSSEGAPSTPMMTRSLGKPRFMRVLSQALVAWEPWLLLLATPVLTFDTPWMPEAMVLIALLWVAGWVADGRPLPPLPLNLPLLGLLVMVSVGVLVALPLDAEEALLIVRHLVLGLGCFHCLARLHARGEVRKGTAAFFAVGMALVGVTIFGTHWPKTKILPLQPLYDRLPLLIADASNANMVAGALVMFVPPAASLALFAPISGLRRHVAWMIRVALSVITLLLIGALLLTQSRGALLGLAIALLVTGLLHSRWVALCVPILAAGAWAAGQRWGWPRLLNALTMTDAIWGWEARKEIWRRAWYLIQNAPLTGSGLGTFGLIAPMRFPFFRLYGREEVVGHAHNLYLQVGVDLGVIGLVSFVALLVMALLMCWRAGRMSRRRGDADLASLSWGLCGSLVAVAVHGLVDSTTWAYRPSVFFWLVMGLIASGYRLAMSLPQIGPGLGVEPLPVPQPRVASPAMSRIEKIQRGHSRRIRKLGLPILLLLAALATGARYARARDRLTLAQAYSENVLTLVREHPEALLMPAYRLSVEKELAKAEAEWAALHRELAPLWPLAAHLGWLPRWGRDLQAAGPMLEMAISLSRAGQHICQGLGPLAGLATHDALTRPLHEGLDQRVISALEAGGPAFRQGRQTLADAKRTRDQIKGLGQSPLSPSLVRNLARLDGLRASLQWGVELGLAAPDLLPFLLGFDAPRTYLILAQDNQELRATGGVISGVGIMKVAQGRVTGVSFRDSYAVDDPSQPYPPPPPPLMRYLATELLLMRDANWSPDFPRSAQLAQQIYRLGHDTQVDGVIAIDLTGLQFLVGAVEPLYVASYDLELTAENLLSSLEEHWSTPQPRQARTSTEGIEGEPVRDGGEFMGTVLEALIGELNSGPLTGELMPVALALRRAFQEKHLLVYLNDPPTQQLVDELGWAGRLAPATADYLLVVDTNMGYNKVDSQVSKRIEYQVWLDEVDSPRAEVTLIYHNSSSPLLDACVQETSYPESYADMMQGCYWDYVRVYVPRGSALLGGPDVPLPSGSLLRRQGDESQWRNETITGPPLDDKEVFGQFFLVAPGETRSLSFAHQLPDPVRRAGDHKTYQLTLEKQPGTEDVPVKVIVHLPAEAELVAADPWPKTVGEGLVCFELILDADRCVSVSYR